MAYKVGWRTLHYCDKSRINWEGTAPRPLLTDIWYPATDDSECREIYLGPTEAPLFKAGYAARDAEIAPGVFPLVLLSHGTGGAALQLGWLASVLAAQGYTVAGVNHHGNNALEPYVAKGFLYWWERAADVSALLTQLLEDEFWGEHIDEGRIGAAGFSLGASTVIALAGGEIDVPAFRAVYHKSDRDLMREIPPEFPDPHAFLALLKTLLKDDTVRLRSYRDERIRCIFAIAPVLGEAFTPAGLEPIDIPVDIVVGEADTLAPAANNASRFASLIKNAGLNIFSGQVGHYVFLGEATEIGREAAPLFCMDPPGVERAALHRKTSDMARDFFGRSFDAR